AYVAPQTETERLIAAVWQQKLQVEKVGIHDNFFDLGGHSLLLIQIHSKFREIFEQELSIIDLFKYPTISSLVKLLSQKQTQKPTGLQNQERVENRSASRALIYQQNQLRQKHRATKK
ncbi:MAG: phosphopantetheine-binding protein, partial [Rhizonema sp. PD38]|nr:phosphopantetheine-binding protein [Rhizonema sp. PD38]